MTRSGLSILGASLSVVALVVGACAGVDEEPASTDAPVATVAPGETDVPVETEAPVETDAPVDTEAPVATEAPVETDAPVNTEAPVVTDAPADAVRPGLRQFCPSVQHGDTSSGIWVRGEVYGLDGGWIWVEGPTINDGEPVQVPVTSGAFDSPLPIVAFDDHQIERFELGSDEIDLPIDLLPTLDQGPGRTFPVGPDEGPLFDTECFDFAEPGDEPASPTDTVAAFLDEFVDAHRAGDVDRLQATLHPSIRSAFGEELCDAYVERTTGSITDATLLDVSPTQPLELDAPSGPVTFAEAIPFQVEFTLVDGSTVTNDAHLPLEDGDVRWLTTCGVDAP